MRATQTHTVTGQPAVRLPEVGDIYFLQRGGRITGWAAAKWAVTIEEAPTDLVIEVSEEDYRRALEDVAAKDRLLRLMNRQRENPGTS